MYQDDWIEKLHAFLTLNDREILEDSGSVSAKIAKRLAETEFEKFKEMESQDYVSDFDRMVAKLEKR